MIKKYQGKKHQGGMCRHSCRWIHEGIDVRKLTRPDNARTTQRAQCSWDQPHRSVQQKQQPHDTQMGNRQTRSCPHAHTNETRDRILGNRPHMHKQHEVHVQAHGRRKQRPEALARILPPSQTPYAEAFLVQMKACRLVQATRCTSEVSTVEHSPAELPSTQHAWPDDASHRTSMKICAASEP